MKEPTQTDAPMGDDDFPVESWLHVTVKPGETKRAIRMRLWLKDGLRQHGIRAVRVSGAGPGVGIGEIAPQTPDNAIPGPAG